MDALKEEEEANLLSWWLYVAGRERGREGEMERGREGGKSNFTNLYILISVISWQTQMIWTTYCCAYKFSSLLFIRCLLKLQHENMAVLQSITWATSFEGEANCKTEDKWNRWYVFKIHNGCPHTTAAIYLSARKNDARQINNIRDERDEKSWRTGEEGLRASSFSRESQSKAGVFRLKQAQEQQELCEQVCSTWLWLYLCKVELQQYAIK